MANYTFADSQYRFIEPIRYFKANDPYYFEVDNLPLKQLQENCLWLRDQLRTISGERSNNESLEIKRKDFDELRPYATGGDRVVRVKPGRFTARINDIGSNPLAYLTKLAGEALDDTDLYKAYGINTSTDAFNQALNATLLTLKQTTASYAQNLNGLTERAFTWAIREVNRPSEYGGLITDALSYTGVNAGSLGPFLYSEAILPWAMSVSTGDTYYSLISSYPEGNQSIGYSTLPLLESEFIKRWRGVARTAIVDIPTELTVEVPEFNDQDFYYTDENGAKVYQTAASRIDLVFIYSKPVDASSTLVLKNGAVNTLTAPALGIVRGAGIGPSFQRTTTRPTTTTLDSNGNPMIQAHAADTVAANIGFASSVGNELSQDIKGSFPSPEDLLNLSPLLCNELEDNAIELVGQSILPVAYVYVRRVPTTIAGSEVIDTADIIDIRPFFRTAELTYNERAGLAAAVPQLSLANPAVGRSQLDAEMWKMTNYVETKINQIINDQNDSGSTNFATSPRVAATGYIFGGYNFGPEAVLLKFYKAKFLSDNIDNDSISYIKNYIQSKYGYGDVATVPFNIPARPDWDLAEWCKLGNFSEKGYYPNDRINAVINAETSTGDAYVKAGSSSKKVLPAVEGTTPTWLSSDWIKKFENVTEGQSSQGTYKVGFYYISKKIKFVRPQWMIDYHVDVELVNSILRTERGLSPELAAYTGVWVEKGYNEFTIYVGFNGRSFWDNGPVVPLPNEDRESARFSNFLVMVRDILTSETTSESTGNAGFTGNVRLGICTYPTVKWKFVAIPRAGAGDFHYVNLNSDSPTITLQGG